jgi:hypothetical protein
MKAAGKQRNPGPPTPPPAKDLSPIQKITSAIKKKIPLISVHGSNKVHATTNTSPQPQLPTHDTLDPSAPTQPAASTAPVTDTAEEDDTITLKKLDLR